MKAFKQSLTLILLFLLAILVTFSIHPTIAEISNRAGIVKGSILSRYIIVVFGVLFFINFRMKEMMQSTMIKAFLFQILVIAFFSLLTYSFFSNDDLFGEIRSLLISWAALSIGWQIQLSNKQIKYVFLIYSLSVFYVGLAQVFTTIGGFVIEDQYLVDCKNSLGVLIASSIAVFTFFAVEKKTKKFYSLLCWGIIIALFVVVLTIRARMATLTALFVFLLILYRRIDKSYFVIILALMPTILFLGYLILPSGIKEYVLSSFTAGYGDGGDFTAGRAERNRMALNYLYENPILGNLQRKSRDIGWIHNYPILQLFNNGLLFGFPIVGLYLFLFVKIAINVFRSKVNDIREIGYFALLVPFIVSLAEPTFPFGPGTNTVFCFIAYGVALRHTHEKTINLL